MSQPFHNSWIRTVQLMKNWLLGTPPARWYMQLRCPPLSGRSSGAAWVSVCTWCGGGTCRRAGKWAAAVSLVVQPFWLSKLLMTSVFMSRIRAVEVETLCGDKRERAYLCNHANLWLPFFFLNFAFTISSYWNLKILDKPLNTWFMTAYYLGKRCYIFSLISDFNGIV